MKVKATVHGAISIVNAIATGKGSTLGISDKVEVIAEATEGTGISIETENRNLSSRLINKTIEKLIPKNKLVKTKLKICLNSQIPTGFGLKSSSAISSAVALACANLFKPRASDSQILLAGVDASIETKVSITGAYDDACACYYGGFIVTDNLRRKLVRSEKGPKNNVVVIFIPKNRRRGNVKNLKTLDVVFDRAWDLAKNGDYWNAMIINGLATSVILNSDPKIITELVENGAIGASVSGNGPAIAAVTKKQNVNKIKKVFSNLEGRTVTSQINNQKAEAHEL